MTVNPRVYYSYGVFLCCRLWAKVPVALSPSASPAAAAAAAPCRRRRRPQPVLASLTPNPLATLFISFNVDKLLPTHARA